MIWRTRFLAVLATVFASLLSVSAQAQTLYAATGSNGVAAQLFLVNANNGSASLIGPITIGGVAAAVTGLAVHPSTGVLYGITGGGGVNPRSLITISTANGAATLVGPMGAPGSDIAFSPGGVLYVWQQTSNTLGILNLGTGAATSLGASGLGGTNGGGLAISYSGVPIVSVTGSAGTLDAINTSSGAGTTGPAMTGAPQPFAMNAMSYDAAGTLFAVNTNGGGIALTNLVSINTATGAVTNLGVLPTDTDALAFAFTPSTIPTMSEWAMIAMALLLAVTGFVAMRRRAG